MAIRAGAMRNSVDIEERHKAKGTMGGVSDKWTPKFSKVAASIEPLQGRELFTAQQNHSEVTVRVRIRYREGVVAAQRVAHKGVIYSILYVINPGMRNVELQLMCSVGVNQG